MRPTCIGEDSGVPSQISIPSSWSTPLADYLAWLRAAHRAEGTIYLHSYHLRRYAHATERPPWPVTVQDLADYLATFETGPAARRTVRQVLRGFYGWGKITEQWETNPAAHLPTVAAPRGLPRPAPEHSVRVGLSAHDVRVQMMVRLAARAGLRCREVCQVHTDDVVPDLVGYSLRVQGKGGHMRLVPIDNDLARRITEHPPGFLFPGRINGHLSASRVSELISEALPPGITAHQLRHRFATRAYALGGRDITAVQRLLGHAHLTTTQVYVDVADDALRRAALAAAG